MMIIFISLKLSAANSHKSNPVPVFGVKIRMNLKYKTTQFIFVGTNLSVRSRAALGRRCNSHKGFQEFLNTKIIDGAAKKNRGDFPREVIIYIQCAMHTFHKFYILAKHSGIFLS